MVPCSTPEGSDVKNEQQREWITALVAAIGELNGVAGGHARSYYEMAPRSVVARVSGSLVGGYSSYGFDPEGAFIELARLNKDDLPAAEFWLGGEVVRGMEEPEKARLEAAGAHLFANPQKALAAAATAAFPS